MKKLKENINLFVIALILLVCFVITYKYILPINYSNISGMHSWLSGSTIKYVNYWLKDGATNLKFANIEYPASIEYPTFMSRGPYVSYPTGSTLFVWIFARLLGKKSIDIIYLKKFQCILYYFETIFIAYSSYILISNFTDLERKIKTIVCILVSLFWIYLPANAWFLANIFFADQAVIFWILLTFFIENLETTSLKNSKTLFIIKELTIVIGVLTDYYYWIYVFFVCLFNFIRSLFVDKKLSVAIYNSLQYIIPVFLAICLYIFQMSFVENWKTSLFNKFKERTGITSEVDINTKLIRNITKNFSQNTKKLLLPLVSYIFCVVLYINIYLFKNKKICNIFINKSINTICSLFIATITQIIILKDHSAVHEFSVVKLCILLCLFLIIVLISFSKIYNKKLGIISFCISLILFLFITGAPFSTRNRVLHENEKYDPYILEHIISENTEYCDVCYSFTYEIVANPPQNLAISNKTVHKINSLKDIKQILGANNILVIEKGKEIDSETRDQIESVFDKGIVIFENSNYCLIRIS